MKLGKIKVVNLFTTSDGFVWSISLDRTKDAYIYYVTTPDGKETYVDTPVAKIRKDLTIKYPGIIWLKEG